MLGKKFFTHIKVEWTIKPKKRNILIKKKSFNAQNLACIKKKKKVKDFLEGIFLILLLLCLSSILSMLR